jgi:CheY-like chemotaxis protein
VCEAAGGCEILVVDDDEDIRNTMAQILTEEGYSVTAVADGLKALAELENGSRPQLILLDLMMPQMDGSELLRRLGQEARHSAIPVVVITASTTVKPPPGAVAILRKPLLLERLLELVERFDRRGETA